MLFMDHSKLKYDKGQVDDRHFKLAKWTIFNEFKIKEDTKFILSDYTDMTHFSLLVQINPQISVFTQSTLPVEARKLVDSIDTILQEYRDQNVGKTGKLKANADKADKPTKAKAKSDSDSEGEKKKSEPAKVDSDDESKVNLKPKVTEKKSEPEPVTEKSADSGYIKADLEKMKIPDLKELLKDEKYKNVPKTGLKKEDLIDCLVKPDQDKCKTKRSKKGGDNYTRRK